MKKKIFVALLAVIVLAGGAMYAVLRARDKSVNRGSRVDNNESSLCDSNVDLDYIGRCFTDLAVDNLDYTLCGEIYDPVEERFDPQFDPNFISAEKYQIGCYVKVFHVIGDMRLCKKIKNQAIRDYCFQSVGIAQQRSVACGKIVDEYMQRQCYYKISLCLSNFLLCDKIDDLHTKDDCRFKVAIAQNNSSLCDSVGGVALKEECYEFISGTKNSLSECGRYDDASLANSCYFRVAEKINDISVCDKIMNDSILKRDCLELFECK